MKSIIKQLEELQAEMKELQDVLDICRMGSFFETINKSIPIEKLKNNIGHLKATDNTLKVRIEQLEQKQIILEDAIRLVDIGFAALGIEIVQEPDQLAKPAVKGKWVARRIKKS